MRVVIDVQSFFIPELNEGHFILSQCACFIRTNVVCSSHGLAGGHFPDQIVVIEHFLGGVSQGQGHSQRQAFWNSNDDDCDSQNEISQNFSDVLAAPVFVNRPFHDEPNQKS